MDVKFCALFIHIKEVVYAFFGFCTWKMSAVLHICMHVCVNDEALLLGGAVCRFTCESASDRFFA